MPADVVADLGHLFLGSRLKRLAERLQADAAKVHRAMGIDAQPAELALLAALDRQGPMTISNAVDALGVSQPAVTRTASALVERELVTSETGEDDQRQKVLTLTRSGKAPSPISAGRSPARSSSRSQGSSASSSRSRSRREPSRRRPTSSRFGNGPTSSRPRFTTSTRNGFHRCSAS